MRARVAFEVVAAEGAVGRSPVRQLNVSKTSRCSWKSMMLLALDVIRTVRPHIRFMENFDFEAPAEVFTGRGRGKGFGPVRYRRFRTGAEAVRHVIEAQKPDLLMGTVVEVDDMRFTASEIQAAYDSADYPLPRGNTN